MLPEEPRKVTVDFLRSEPFDFGESTFKESWLGFIFCGDLFIMNQMIMNNPRRRVVITNDLSAGRLKDTFWFCKFYK